MMEFVHAITKTQKMLGTCLESDLLRVHAQDFTRERILTAPTITAIILHRVYHSLQLTLDAFFAKTNPFGCASKQALSQGRQKVSDEFLRSFADMTSEIGAKAPSNCCYKGMLLIAIDGSTAALENYPDLLDLFGGSGPKQDAATAQISIAFNPGSGIMYDYQIDRYGTDERLLAQKHIVRLKRLGLKRCLLLFDRGYPSAELIAFLYECGFDFVMRVRKQFNTEIDEIERLGGVFLKHNRKRYSVRVLKIPLPNGEVETLLTSLSQKKLPMREAAEVYFERWKVETEYETLKVKLELENFSGKKGITVLQDFYATMYLGNLLAFTANESDAVILERDAGKDLKYKRKTNLCRAIANIRDVFLYLLTLSDVDELLKEVEKLIQKIARYPIQIVPGRSYPRKIPRKKRFYQTRRSVVSV